MRYLVLRTAIVATAFLVYEVLAQLKILDPFTFIPFSKMVSSAFALLTNPEFLSEHILPTSIEIGLSFLFSSVLGIVTGILLWRSNFLYQTIQPYLMLFYAIPIFAVYPVFISLFGMGPLPVIIIAMCFSIVAIISNTAVGLRETKKVLVKVGQSMNLTPWKMIFYIYLPAAWPYIFTGLKLGLAYSIIGVVATEFILSTRGLGHSIAFSYNNFDLNGMYGSILIVILIVIVVNAVLGYIESRLYHSNAKGS
ncbi:ABC transporter permease [Aneurinibacillus tyrosinisolvens]|uniref:ABC transporter permease n=1 Tax=Aneurinibacillus tyrosinisolvens TaxID=1443435 RepID=UPI00069B9820|nr:ABC transporter permease [Aneurinibacillus tyrosinisolvens]